MLDILDLPEVRQRMSRLSIAEYHQLGEFNENGRRTELIRGLVIEKMSKTPLHRFLSLRLHEMVLRMIPKGFFVMKEEPLTLADSEPEPDLSVVPGSGEDYMDSHPQKAALVVEVAVSNPALDRANADLYAEAGISEFWIVLGAEKRIEIYRQPVAGKYQRNSVISRDQSIQCEAVPQISFKLSDLFTP